MSIRKQIQQLVEQTLRSVSKEGIEYDHKEKWTDKQWKEYDAKVKKWIHYSEIEKLALSTHTMIKLERFDEDVDSAYITLLGRGPANYDLLIQKLKKLPYIDSVTAYKSNMSHKKEIILNYKHLNKQ